MAILDNITPPHDIQAYTDLDGATGTEKDGVEYTTFWKFYPNGEAYFAQIFKPRLEISIEEVRDAMRRIPDTEIYPEIPEDANLKIVETIDNTDGKLYIKRPSLNIYETDYPHALGRELFLGEAQIMEQLSCIPHKNIVPSHGCQWRDGRLTGILLRRHAYSLFEYFLWGIHESSTTTTTITTLDAERFMAELESAVTHLHAAGLAHNDLKPTNILLDEQHMPVLIDFGSCRAFGARLLEGGTPGWCDDEKLVTVSDKEHDRFALEKIREWIGDPDRQMRG
ncbi:kinase-like protein [Xylaria arbuscula]|nr:kinase-like protein [Xylaria arbuscula]